MKREVRLVLRDALCSVTNGTRRSGAGERAGGLTVECEREEKAADDKLCNRYNGALAAAEKF